jgi:hypothetical protein
MVSNIFLHHVLDDRKTVDRFPGLLGHEGNQLAKRVTVAMLGVEGEFAFGDDVLK